MQEKETKSSAEEDMGMSGEVGGAGKSLGYIIWFASTVELYQKKNCNCFGCGSLDHLVKDCPKDLGKTARKVSLNLKEGTAKNGGWTSTGYPGQSSLSIKMSWKVPFLNPDPLTCWSVPENIALAKINDESSWALLDTGSTINVVTPEFIKACSLDVSPLGDLVDSTLMINGFGGLFSQPFGYVIIRVQVEWVKGYDKDQVI